GARVGGGEPPAVETVRDGTDLLRHQPGALPGGDRRLRRPSAAGARLAPPDGDGGTGDRLRRGDGRARRARGGARQRRAQLLPRSALAAGLADRGDLPGRADALPPGGPRRAGQPVRLPADALLVPGVLRRTAAARPAADRVAAGARGAGVPRLRDVRRGVVREPGLSAARTTGEIQAPRTVPPPAVARGARRSQLSLCRLGLRAV